jgi:hypothetical protein
MLLTGHHVGLETVAGEIAPQGFEFCGALGVVG